MISAYAQGQTPCDQMGCFCNKVSEKTPIPLSCYKVDQKCCDGPAPKFLQDTQHTDDITMKVTGCKKFKMTKLYIICDGVKYRRENPVFDAMESINNFSRDLGKAIDNPPGPIEKDYISPGTTGVSR